MHKSCAILTPRGIPRLNCCPTLYTLCKLLSITRLYHKSLFCQHKRRYFFPAPILKNFPARATPVFPALKALLDPQKTILGNRPVKFLGFLQEPFFVFDGDSYGNKSGFFHIAESIPYSPFAYNVNKVNLANTSQKPKMEGGETRTTVCPPCSRVKNGYLRQ